MEQTTTFNDYIKKCFSKKLLIQKGIIAGCALILVLAFSLSFFFWLNGKDDGVVGQENGFWYIWIERNPGIGWSAMSGKYGTICAIQSIMFVLLLALLIFLTHDKITSSFVSMAMFGGLFNLLQRATASDHCVLDYFRFGFWNNFPIFNWPDMFVVIGIFGFVISYIALTVVQAAKDSQNNE